jgi:hypothetical protein
MESVVAGNIKLKGGLIFMSCTKKADKFFIYAAKKYGHFKGKRLLGIKHTYKEGSENLTLQDLLDFLKDKDIEPSTVEFPDNFITTVVKK